LIGQASRVIGLFARLCPEGVEFVAELLGHRASTGSYLHGNNLGHALSIASAVGVSQPPFSAPF
jgi:hypothetical protein